MKKLLSLLLVLCLMLTLAVPAFAAHSMDNFRKVKTYNNEFTDVPADHWARNAVATCYEYGLMNGADAATFNLAGNLTVAEALVIAAQVDQIYKTGTTAIQPAAEGPWYQSFVDYCVNTGITKAGAFSDFNAKATRAQMAGIFAHALPDSTFTVLSLCTPPDLTHGVTVAVPQDMLDITDPDVPEQPMFASISTGAMAMALFQQDASLRHTDMGMVKRLFDQALPSMLQEIIGDGESISVTDSVSVKFGDMDAIRYHVTYTTEGVATNMIIYVYVQDDVMGAVYLVETDAPLMNTMANSVRINGAGVNPTV